ncbi:MAG: halocarboxylic acid dehydrogenase DehI family protein [Candidatus Korobacteraceae bacterium]
MRWRRGHRLKLVGEAEAPPRTREIFDEVRHKLGLPVVPILYQAYAAYPDFLEIHWQTFRPAIGSRQFFLLGARLAAESYTRIHNYFDVGSLASRELHSNQGPGLSLAQVLDYYQYLDPLLLLIASAQLQAFEGPVGTERLVPEPAQHPNFPVSPCLLDGAAASPTLQRVWDERRRAMELAFISDEHRAMARWPGFYDGYSRALQELMRSPLFTDCQHRINESAWGLVGEIPARIETGLTQLLDAGLSHEQTASIVYINEALCHAFSGLVLDITFARVAYEGGTHREGRAHPRSVGEAEPKESGSPTQAA